MQEVSKEVGVVDSSMRLVEEKTYVRMVIKYDDALAQ